MTQTDRNFGLVANLGIKVPVVVATTAAITLSGLQTVDGVLLVADDRVLVKNQASSVDNGIYSADSGAWSRTQDCDGTYDLVTGSLIKANFGTANSGFWYCTATNPIVVGTTALTFATASTYLAVVSAFVQTLLDDTSAAAFMTTLGISAFIQTLVDDTTAAAARTTLGFPLPDTATIVTGSSDTSKLLRFEVDGFTTATTRVSTPPNYDHRIMSQTHGADVASSGTINLDTATGDLVDVTGTTTITAVTLAEGKFAMVRFTGILTLTHGASLVLPGSANITTAAGDLAIMRGYAAGVVRVAYFPLTGQSVISRITLGTPTASTSGTSIDFTGIPADAKEITFNFVGVSTSGTSTWLLQLGDAGGVETSGYLSSCANNGATVANSTAGIIINTGAAASLLHGSVVFSLVNASTFTWAAQGTVTNANGNVFNTAGSKSTSAVLDRIRLTTTGGADTFDAGSVNISYKT